MLRAAITSGLKRKAPSAPKEVASLVATATGVADAQEKQEPGGAQHLSALDPAFCLPITQLH